MTYPPWPAHVHAFKGVVDYKECLQISRSRFRSEAERVEFEATDARLLEQEKEWIRRLNGPRPKP